MKNWKLVIFLVLFATAGGAVFITQNQWMPLLSQSDGKEEGASEVAEPPAEEPKVLKLSSQAQKNLNLIVKPARTQTYWRKIQVPGVIADRPGRSDRGVTSPVVGVVSNVHAFPGETVRPGEKLFTLMLTSEYLQNTQKELFSATKETQLIQEQLERLRPLAESGGVPRTKIIDLENQLRRQEALIQAHQQDLSRRGLSSDEISRAAEGSFISNVDVVAPPPIEDQKQLTTIQLTALQQTDQAGQNLAYEVQELNAELGQQVQAGQLLSTLSDHSSLYIEGHAFKREAPYLEQAAQNNWEVVVEFAEDVDEYWPALQQKFTVRYISNTIDTQSRTFDFYLPLTNQSRTYRKEEKTFVVWRFRPGQRVRLHVPVEKMDDVLVLPSSGVVRENADAYVFQQNGDLFNRISVEVLHEDRLNTVIANDGSVTPGLFLAQNSAASLNRILKAQAASGMRADVHVHADGTVHASH